MGYVHVIIIMLIRNLYSHFDYNILKLLGTFTFLISFVIKTNVLIDKLISIKIKISFYLTLTLYTFVCLYIVFIYVCIFFIYWVWVKVNTSKTKYLAYIMAEVSTLSPKWFFPFCPIFISISKNIMHSSQVRIEPSTVVFIYIVLICLSMLNNSL